MLLTEMHLGSLSWLLSRVFLCTVRLLLKSQAFSNVVCTDRERFTSIQAKVLWIWVMYYNCLWAKWMRLLHPGQGSPETVPPTSQLCLTQKCSMSCPATALFIFFKISFLWFCLIISITLNPVTPSDLVTLNVSTNEASDDQKITISVPSEEHECHWKVAFIKLFLKWKLCPLSSIPQA